MAHLQPASDRSLLVSFPTVSGSALAQVLALTSRLSCTPLPGLTSFSPAAASVLLRFDPLLIDPRAFAAAVQELLPEPDQPLPAARRLELPVCYEADYAPDLPVLAAAVELSPAAVIERHAAVWYEARFLGFLPGFAYLGDVDERIALPRLATPRLAVPAGSVGIAGRQTGIYPAVTPGGWNLIGRCPSQLFNPSAPEPALIRPGDRVRFVPVSAAEFRRLQPA